MKENNYIWTPKQYRAYYKAVSNYQKIKAFKSPLNDYEKRIKEHLLKVQACLDIRKMESDVSDFHSFNEDSELMNNLLADFVECLQGFHGLIEQKKFSYIALTYLLSIKPIV